MIEYEIKPRIIVLILCGITLVGVALRLYHLNYQSLWYDELHSIIPTDPDNSLASVIAYCKIDQPPAFFIFLYYFFHVFGYDAIVGRVAVALLGVISIPVMYLLGTEIRNRNVGLFAALLTSLNYMHIYYSQEMRFYSMAFLFTALSFLFLVRAYKDGKIVNFSFYVLFTTALLYTHYYGLVIYGVQIIVFFALMLVLREWKLVPRALISGVLIPVLFIPWIPVVLSDLNISTFWIRMPKPTFLAEYFYYYFGKDAFVTATFALLIWLFLRPHFRKNGMDRGSRTMDVILLVWLVFSYLIPYIKSFIGPPMLYVRYTIVSLPAWFLILSIGWDRVTQKRWKYGIAVAISLSMLINLFFVRKHYFRVSKQQFRELSALVKEKNTDSTPVYSRFFWHFNFYFRNDDTKVNDLGITDFSKVDKFWLLHAEFFSADEKTEILGPFSTDFEIAQDYKLHKTDALLLRRKQPTP